MIGELKQNIETEIEILREISNNIRMMDYASASERKLLVASITSLQNSMKVINNSVPKIVENLNLVKQLPREEIKTSLDKVSFTKAGGMIQATIESKDKEILLKELSLNTALIEKIKRKKLVQEEDQEERKAVRGYLKFSNKLFLNYSHRLIKKGFFKTLSVDIRKGNLDILFSTYVAMILTTTVISFVASWFIAVFFLFFNIGIDFPMITLVESGIMTRLGYVILIPIIVPIITFAILTYYPSAEKDSLKKRIDQELPFAVIHMSAISGSGIEPTEIFKIIGLSKEYKYLRKEIRKVLNQINLYGYDLVNSLNNVAKNTPSIKLAELFGGLATTITSGSSLQDFFEKRAQTLMSSYRLEREKYTRVAELFMDIYITVVLAAPMILMIVLILIIKMKLLTGFTSLQLTFIVISIIALINTLFLVIIHMKQPNY